MRFERRRLSAALAQRRLFGNHRWPNNAHGVLATKQDTDAYLPDSRGGENRVIDSVDARSGCGWQEPASAERNNR